MRDQAPEEITADDLNYGQAYADFLEEIMSYKAPEEITQIDIDYGLVHVAGDTSLLGPDYLRVAVVGSRDATPDGLRRSYTVAKRLAERDVVVVSGLARGVDIEAHAAAVYGGRTIAVIATPLHRVYPPWHGVMQEHIYNSHLLVTPFDQYHRQSRHDFLERNRLMASIVDAVVVIEANNRSGTMQMVRSSLDADKPVLVVSPQPHDVDWAQVDPYSRIRHEMSSNIVDAVFEAVLEVVGLEE